MMNTILDKAKLMAQSRLSPEQIKHGREWIAALRSGEYKQIQKRLIHADDSGVRFCCLGVGADISGLCVRQPTAFDYKEFMPGHESRMVLMWDEDGRLDDHFGIDVDITSKLANMNDTQNLSFAEIADYLEDTIYGRE